MTEIYVLFPPPDKPVQVKNVYDIEVVGAAIVAVETMQGMGKAKVRCVALDGDDTIRFRFLLPNHARVLRDFFRDTGVKWDGNHAHVSHEYTVKDGAFLIAFSGTVIGEDNIPEGAENPPRTIYVLRNTKARQIPLPPSS